MVYQRPVLKQETTAVSELNNGTVSAEKYFGTVGGKNGLMQNYIYSANNARLQEAHLGYKLPAKMVQQQDECHLFIDWSQLIYDLQKSTFRS
jgi:hypothetical protein